MEEDFFSLVMGEFEQSIKEPERLTPLMLAYIGDAVYEVLARSLVISKGNKAINQVHKDNVKFVNATTQARISEIIEDKLTEAELSQLKRGRNAKTNTSAKNSSLADYRKATGFEALMGYLYLTGQKKRIVELCKLGFKELELI